MEDDVSAVTSSWGHTLLTRLLHPLTVAGTPLVVLTLLCILLWRAFSRGFPDGLRSFAGVLLPLVIASFVLFFQRPLVERLGAVSVMPAFLLSYVWGIGSLALVNWLWDQTAPVPISELILSGSFSVLILSYVVLPQAKVLSYFSGAVAGLLSYIILFGLPLKSGLRA